MGVFIKQSFSWWQSQGELAASELLSGRQARRASFLARASATAIEQVGGFDPTMSVVFGSCLGNITVTMELLEQLYQGQRRLSPIRFMNSVHHAAVSQVNIAAKRRGFITAVSGDAQLCAVAVMEAIGLCLDRRHDVVVVLGEEQWPASFRASTFDAYVGAVRLGYGPDVDHNIGVERAQPGESGQSLPAELRGNPAAWLEHVIDFAQTDGQVGRLISPANMSPANMSAGSEEGAWKICTR